MSWKVYKLTSPNGRVYIGRTGKDDLNIRWQDGRGYRFNKELWNDIILYGWISFNKEVIAEYDTKSEASEREHLEIKNYPDGYNIYRGTKPYTPTGNPVTPPKPVKCMETGIIYKSIKEAARQTGLASNKISYCCRGIRRSTGGYHWEFVEC